MPDIKIAPKNRSCKNIGNRSFFKEKGAESPFLIDVKRLLIKHKEQMFLFFLISIPLPMSRQRYKQFLNNKNIFIFFPKFL